MMNTCVDTHHHLDSLLLHWRLVVGGVTDSHQRVDVEPLQLLAHIGIELARGVGHNDQTEGRWMMSYLGELVERGVGGVVGDEEPHALVGNLYCGGAVHVGETALRTITIRKILQNKRRLLAQKSQKTA